MTFPPESSFGKAITQMRGAANQDALVRKVRKELSVERTAEDDRDIRRLRERLSDVRDRLDGYVINRDADASEAFLAEIAGELDDIEQNLRRHT